MNGESFFPYRCEQQHTNVSDSANSLDHDTDCMTVMHSQQWNEITNALRKAKHVKIGFSFGAASYYRETSSFSPFGHICFCLKSNNTLFSEEYIAFYNQDSVPDDVITYTDGNSDNPYEELFVVQLDRLPTEIEALLFVSIMHLPEYSDHIVRIEMNDTIYKFYLRNLNGIKPQDKHRVILRIRRNDGWVAEFCEEFCDTVALLNDSCD